MRRKREYGIMNMLKTISKRLKATKAPFLRMVLFCCPKPPKAPDRLNKSKQRRYLFEETNQKRIKEGGRADLLRQVPLYGLLMCHYARMLRFTCIRRIGHTDHLGKGNRDHEGRLQSNSSDLHNRRCRNRRRSTAFDELLTKRKNGRRVKSLAQENHHHLGDLKQPWLHYGIRNTLLHRRTMEWMIPNHRKEVMQWAY